MEVIEVKVFPDKRKTKIRKQTGNSYEIEVAAPKENNEANIELIKFIKRHFKKEAKIIIGLKSPKKLIKLLP